MPLTATTLKLTDSDKQIIEALKAKHGITAMSELIRMSLTYTLLNKPVEKCTKKSPWTH